MLITDQCETYTQIPILCSLYETRLFLSNYRFPQCGTYLSNENLTEISKQKVQFPFNTTRKKLLKHKAQPVGVKFGE